MSRKILIGAFIALLPWTACWAQNAATDSPAKPTVLSAWLALPGVGRIAWPYAFGRADSTNDAQRAKRKDLFEQIDQLAWRLNERGYRQYAKAVRRWKAQLSKTHSYRLPGNWSPAWLMAHPHKRPPYDLVAAIGYCELPNYVGIWDSKGWHRQPWKSGLRLSDVMADDAALSGGNPGEVAVVTPMGEVDHYGVGAWNHADTALSPGTRIVGAIALKGDVFPWMRDAIAGLLAHTPSGTHCRQFPLSQGAADE